MKTTISQRCLKHQDAFKYFIERHFPNKVIVLEEMAKVNRNNDLCIELNNIWFSLPDGVYNIIVNPPGWSEFLKVIED